MWGVVYQSSNGAGFALEFIGDMHDSNSINEVVDLSAIGAQGFAAGQQTQGGGRGIN
jgi:hypothetical protein